MALAAWHSTITDDKGNVLPHAQIYVVNEASGGVAQLYSDRNGTVGLGNPFQATAEGFAAFHVVGGAYRITATLGGTQQVWRYVGIGTAQETDIGEFGSGLAGWDAVEQTPAGLSNHTGEAIGFRVLVVDAADNRSAIYEKTGAGASWTNPIFVTGSQGAPGAANELVIGSVVEGSASATITGSVPQQVLNLSIPKGKTGDAGPPNVLGIGTVTGGATASATITGQSPNQQLSLVLPRGPQGNTGPRGPVGDVTPEVLAAKAAAEAARDAAVVAKGDAELSASTATTQAAAASASATAANTSATNAATSASEASTSAGAAATSAATATTQATDAGNSASAAAGSASTASGAATTATTQAGIATTQAGNASGSATAAAGSASAADAAETGAESARDAAVVAQAAAEAAQAGVSQDAADATAAAAAAAISETNAASSASASAGSATTATTQAGIATTQAGVATDKASEASGSASGAAASATTATTQAGIATTAAGAASDSAADAATSEGNASASATASQSARVASETARNEAQSARDDASDSASAASLSETNAAGSATDAATQAGIATTQASDAASSASNASGSASAASGSASTAATQAGIATTQAGIATNAADDAGDARDAAWEWSSADEDEPVDDGLHQGFSAYHWSRKAEVAAGGGVQSVSGGTGVSVDNTDPFNPAVGLDAPSVASLGKADTALQTLTQGANITITGTGTARTISATSAPQVNADWDASSGVAEILNKPTLGTAAAQNVGAFATAAQGSKADTALQTLTQGANITITGSGTARTIAATVPAAPVTSVAGKTGVVTLVKSDVGLGNVDNTSDLAKPISTATQTALNGKIAKAGDTGLGGFTSEGHNLGNLTGTVTPEPTADSNFKYAGNNAAFTLAAPTTAGYYTIAILVTNAASGAGAMTATGFTGEPKGTFSTDANKKQRLFIEVYGSDKFLTIEDKS